MTRSNLIRRALSTLFRAGMIAALGFVHALSAMPAHAAVSPLNVVTYQGRILNTNGVPVADPSLNMQFRLFDSLAAGTCLWSNDSSTCASNADQSVTLTDGLFSENLGDTGAGYAAIPDSVFADNASVFLEVEVAGETLAPRKPMTAAPYALNAQTLDGLDATDFATTANAFIDGGNSFGADATLGTNDANNLAFETNNTTRVTIDTVGLVGIGDTTPDALLDVAGDFQFDGNAIFGAASGASIISRADSWSFPSNTTVALSSNVNAFNFDANTLSIDASNNRIGIGTASPDARLDIEASQDTERIRLTDSSNADSTGVYVGSGSPSGSLSAEAGSLFLDETGTVWVNTNGVTNWTDLTSGSGGANTALSNLTATAVNQSLIPGSDNAIDLGSDTLRWRDLFLDAGSLHIGSSGDESNIAYSTGSDLLTFQNSVDSTTAFQFLDADGGTPILNVDGTNERVGIGTASPASTIDAVASQTGAADITSYNFTVNTSGTGSNFIGGLGSTLAGTFTGSGFTAAGFFYNTLAGTNTTYGSNSEFGYLVSGNRGVEGLSTGTTTGHNVGGLFVATRGDRNYGSWSSSTVPKSGGTNVGAIGFGLNAGGGGAVQVGGYFSLFDPIANTAPTIGTSAALIADNGSQTSDIFSARDNHTAVFTVADGGNLTATGDLAVNGDDITSDGSLVITSATASTYTTTAGNISLQPAGAGTANVQIGTGVASTTPDLLVVDLKSTAGDPAGTNGATYYNSNSNSFRCFENGTWKDCDTGAASTSLQDAYDNGATITTSGATDIAFTLTSGNFTASGAGSVSLTPTAASTFTSGGALTLTGGAASTWGTTAGNLSLQVAGTGTTANVQIGAGGGGSTTPDLLVVDTKSNAGDPTAVDGGVYYNGNTGVFRIAEGGVWKTVCNKTDQGCGAGTGSALSAITAAVSGNSIDSGDNAQAWNWTLTTAAKTAFTFGETAAATNGAGNQSIVDITTLATSTASPLRVTSGGTADTSINLASTGDFVIQDAGATFATFSDAGLITFSGNLDATNGVDVTGANLTVGGANFTVAPASGNVTTAGDIAVNGGDITSTAALTIDANATVTLGSDDDFLPGGGTTDNIGSAGARWDNIFAVNTDFSGTVTSGDFACTDCLDFTEFTDAMSLDASTSVALGASTYTVNASGAGNVVTNLSSTGDLIVQDAGSAFLTIDDTGGYAFTLDATDNPTYTITDAGSSNVITNLSGTGDFVVQDAGTTFFTLSDTRTADFTSNVATGTAFGLTDTSLTTGTLFSSTASNNSASATAWNANVFSVTNAQGTTGNTGTGVDLRFTQSPTVAGNTENAMRIQNQVTTNTTDTTVSNLLLLDNADTSATGSTVVDSGLKISVSGALANGITNGVDASDANILNALSVGANTITGSTAVIDFTNFDVSAAGTVTIATGQSYTGSGTVTLSSASASTLTVDSGTTGALNIGTGANAKVITIGNTTGNTSMAIQVGTGALDLGNTGTDHSTSLGSASGASPLQINSGSSGGTYSTAAATGVGLSFSANSVTSGVGLALSATGLTTGAATRFTSTSNSASASAWSANEFNPTNAQGTTANASAGVDINYRQNTSIAGNTEDALRVDIISNTSATTDATVDAIIHAVNNDTATGNQITATNGLLVSGANVTNGINLSGTFGTNLITSTNFVVTQAGNVSNSGSFAFDGNGTFGDAAGDTITSNAAAWTFANATTVALASSTSALNFDSGTFVIDSTNNRIGIGDTTPDVTLDVVGNGQFTDSAASNTLVFEFGLSAFNSAAVGGAGLGVGTNYQLENSSGLFQEAAEINAIWEDATSGSEDASIRFLTMQAGTVTEAARIDNNGFFGILTSAPAEELDVAGQIQFDLDGTTDTLIGVCKDDADGVGVETGVEFRDCSSTPSDYAEWYETTGAEQAGDLVAFSDATITYQEELYDPATKVDTGTSATYTSAVLAKTSGAYQGRLAGVVSTNPNPTIGESVRDAGAHPKPIALAGRVPVKVNAEGGAIAAGDPITSSSVAGVGMKSNQPAQIIGYALDAFTGPGQGTVLVFIHPGFHTANTIATDGTSGTFNEDFAFGAKGTADATTQGYDSYGLALRGSGWDGAAAQRVAMTLVNAVSSASQYKLSIRNQSDAEVAYVTNDGAISVASDVIVGGKLFPSAAGTAQTDKYIFYGGVGDDYMRTNASGWGTGSYDFAEMFPSAEVLEPGDVVAFDMAGGERMKKAGADDKTRLAGIVSTKPGFVAGDMKAGDHAVALAGRVPVKVTAENGAIAVGDALTVSTSHPGYAMKATEAGMIVGYALEAASSDTSVTAFVHLGYWPGTGTQPAAGTANTASSLSGNLTALNMSGNIYMGGNQILNVGAISGLNGTWSIDAKGTIATESVVKTVITSYQNEKVETVSVTSPDVTISLLGTATLVNGEAVVNFDDVSPTFNDVTSTTAPVRVLVTPNGPVSLYIVSKDHNGFIVREVGAADSGITFDWMVSAYRKDYEPAAPAPTQEVTPPADETAPPAETPPTDDITPPEDVTPPSDTTAPPADAPSDTPPTDVLPADTTTDTTTTDTSTDPAPPASPETPPADPASAPSEPAP